VIQGIVWICFYQVMRYSPASFCAIISTAMISAKQAAPSAVMNVYRCSLSRALIPSISWCDMSRYHVDEIAWLWIKPEHLCLHNVDM